MREIRCVFDGEAQVRQQALWCSFEHEGALQTLVRCECHSDLREQGPARSCASERLLSPSCATRSSTRVLAANAQWCAATG
jgi:hypothetical protein